MMVGSLITVIPTIKHLVKLVVKSTVVQFNVNANFAKEPTLKTTMLLSVNVIVKVVETYLLNMKQRRRAETARGK